METIPELSKDLIKELDRMYPKLTPDPYTGANKIMYDAGARSVVDMLIYKFEEQTKSRLT